MAAADGMVAGSGRLSVVQKHRLPGTGTGRNATVRRSFQCPDANILPGQIKNNMNIRICGRADTTLSTIIIGDGRAAEQIPHDAQGRFLMEDGTVFQAYYFNDDTISKW